MFVSGVTMIIYFNYLAASNKKEIKNATTKNKFKHPSQNLREEEMEKRVVA